MNSGWLNVAVNFESATGTLFATVLCGKDLKRSGMGRSGYPSPFVKVYLLPGRRYKSYALRRTGEFIVKSGGSLRPQ